MIHRSSARLGASPSRRGTSLVVTTVLVCSLAGISLSLAAMSRSSANETRVARDETNAHYVAQAGLAQAVQDLRAGGTGTVGSLQDQQDFGGARFWVDSINLGAGLRSLVATGVDQRAGARIELILLELNLPFFRYGAFGELGLTLDSNATVDSYNSSLGPYSLVNQGDNGDAGSNGDIFLRQNSRIHGSAQAGPDGSTTVLGNAVVTGSTAPAPTTFEIPPIEFPFASNPPNHQLLSGNTNVWLSGNHAIGNLRLDNNATLTITGPAVIVSRSMELRSNSKIIVNDAAGPVEFYVQNDFKLNSNAQIYATSLRPDSVKLFLNGDNIIDPDIDVQVDPGDDDFAFESNSKIYGLVYAPNAFVEIRSNFELFGAMIARRLHLDSNSKIHFDEALLAREEDSEIELQTVLWRRRPFSMSELAR